MKRSLPVLLLLSLFIAPLLRAAEPSLSVDTDYRLRGVSYTNTDFDANSSTDARSYYSQRLRLGLTGKFAPGVEIGTRISAIGVAGSTTTLFNVPYQHSDFSPFIETAYIKLSDLGGAPLDIIAGKQIFSYGDGFIIGDNGYGLTGFRAIGRMPTAFPVTAELLTAKVADNFTPNSDWDVYGATGKFEWKKHSWEVAYFEERNDTGYIYRQGSSYFPTSSVIKQYYDVRLERSDDLSSYSFEVAKQNGSLSRASDGATIRLDGLGYVASGSLTGKNTKLGTVTARALLSIASGDNDPLTFGDDGSFSPDLDKRYDGLERAGYGQLFGATPTGSFFTMPDEYSGYDTLNLGADFSPLFGWTMGVDYYLYSASQGPKGAPTASGFERLFGAEFTLGVEMDLYVKFVHSKYVDMSFSYNRYTPPKSDAFWPKNDPATRYQLELSGRF